MKLIAKYLTSTKLCENFEGVKPTFLCPNGAIAGCAERNKKDAKSY